MKNFKSIREHYSRASYTPPHASEPADDIDINLGVLDEECISRINAYLQKQQGSFINPTNALNKIQRRLATIGLTFTFPHKRPYVNESNGIKIQDETFPVSYMGGRTGVLDTNYTIGTDDNIRWRTGYGLNLKISYQMAESGGCVMVMPVLEKVGSMNESLTTRTREDQIRNAKIKVDRNRKGLKAQFAKWSTKRGDSRASTEVGVSDIGDNHRSINPYDRNPRQSRMAKSIKNLQRKKYAIKGRYDEEKKIGTAPTLENVTTKSPKDQLKSTVRHYDRVMKKRYSKIGRDELKRTGSSDRAYDAVSNAKNATYDKLRLSKAHPENDTHRKLSNLERKVARKRIKAANAGRAEDLRKRRNQQNENTTLKTRRDQALSARADYDRNIKRGLKSIANTGIKSGIRRDDIEDVLHDTRKTLKNRPDIASHITRGSTDRIDRKMNKAANRYHNKVVKSVNHDRDQFVRDGRVSSRLKSRTKKYGS